jgi:hypothetical protein
MSNHDEEIKLPEPAIVGPGDLMSEPSPLKSPSNTKPAIAPPVSPSAKRQQEELSEEAKISYSGIGGTKRLEDDVPIFIECETEDVIQNGNAWIVLGGDRSGNPGSGYSGIGNTHCAAIDLVAGRMGARATRKDANDETVYVNPNFTLDAARIYISQKSDIDHYLRLADGKVGSTSYENPNSCVALKADSIRLVAREGIKLVTGTDVENSQKGEINVDAGIDLIANNDDSDLQPLVKGDNMVECIQEVFKQINTLREMMYNFLVCQKDFNRELMTHTHNSPFFGILTGPSPQVAAQGVKNLVDIIKGVEVQVYNHLNNSNMANINYTGDAGGKSIVSKYNFTN